MYTLTEIETHGLHYLEIASSDSESQAQICLNQGGRLSNFVFEKIQILADFQPSTYKDNFASSVLFPFANRIIDGEYIFEESKYKLDCNEVDKNYAIHGLVYNKTFTCIHKELKSNYASVILQYMHEGKSNGFPFKFNLELTYTLNKKGINLSVKVNSKDEKTFPFALGWHPYFNSVDLDISTISFVSSQEYAADNQRNILEVNNLEVAMPFKLKGMKLDDSYTLKTNEIEFSTPEYGFKLSSTSEDNFLQLYTPDQPNVIAIEPMTGLGNNFNNKIGLQTLHPNDTYIVEWNLAIETFETKIKTDK